MLKHLHHDCDDAYIADKAQMLQPGSYSASTQYLQDVACESDLKDPGRTEFLAGKWQSGDVAWQLAR